MEICLRHANWFLFCWVIVWLLGCEPKQDSSNKEESKLPANFEQGQDNPITNNSTDSSGNTGAVSQKFIGGKLVYEATYDSGKKVTDRLIPLIQDAFLSEDKFYLKIHFPIPYPGEMQIDLEGHHDYALTTIDSQTYQLMVNDALDLDRINLVFDYFPAERDTLLSASYTHQFVIME